MDWKAHLAGLVKETERNLARTPPSYALLRQGVSPGDPHLIAPAAVGPDDVGPDQLIPSFYPEEQPPPLMPAQPPAQQVAQVEKLREELRVVSDQLTLLRQSAAGWQQVAATAAGVDGRCTSAANQLALLSTGVADLQAAQARMQHASDAGHREVQGELEALGARLDTFAAAQRAGTTVGPGGAALAPLSARLEQAEQALAALRTRLEQQAPAAAAAASAAQRQEAQQQELGHINAGLHAMQAAIAAAAQQHASEVAELRSQQGELQAAQRAIEKRSSHIEQVSSQLAVVQAAQSAQGASVQQQARRLEQLAQQLAADVAARPLEQQQQQQPAVPAVSPEALQQLAGQVQDSAGAVAQLQEQVGRLEAVQEAVDDVNQRLFELRVEFQNAGEDGAITAASSKRQAEAAERQAAEAVDAVADVRELAAQLQQQVASLHLHLHLQQTQPGPDAAVRRDLAEAVQQQVQAEVAGLRAELAGSSMPPHHLAFEHESSVLLQTVQAVDEMAAELAGLKLLLAQQSEAAEKVAAASRAEAAAKEERMAGLESAVSALEQLGPGKPALANAVETAACLTTLSDIVHKQREDMLHVKQSVAAAKAAATAATEAIAAGAAAAGDASQLQLQDTVAALEAGMSGLQEQAQAAAAASSQQATEQQQELAGLRLQLYEVQEDLAGAVAVRQDIPTVQLKLAALEAGIESRLGEFLPALSAVQQRLAQLEDAVTQSRQQQQQQQQQQDGAEGGSSPGFQEPAVPAAGGEDRGTLKTRLEQLEAGLEGSTRDAAAQAAQQQQALAALQQQMALMQQQVATLVAGNRQERQQQRLPPELEREVGARVQRTEATVAAALEEAAAQMAALMARMDKAEASSMASATHAQAAALVAQQQVAAVHSMVSLPSRQPSEQQLPQQASEERAGVALSRQGTLKRSQPQQQQPPWQPPSTSSAAASASSSRQSSLRPTKSLPQAQPAEGAQLPQPPARQNTSGGGGLFARLSRSFTSQRRNSKDAAAAAQRVAAAPTTAGAASSSAAAAAAPHGLQEGGSGGFEVPLRVQYSSSLEQEPSLGESQQAGSQSRSAASSPPRSRRTTSGAASGTGTPRRQSSGVQPGGSGSGATGKQLYTPRGRHSSSSQACLSQEHSSGKLTPRQGGSMVGGDSSFGDIPLPQGSSCLISPREDVGERILQLRSELADPDLDEVQREVLASDLERLLERAAQEGRGAG